MADQEAEAHRQLIERERAKHERSKEKAEALERLLEDGSLPLLLLKCPLPWQEARPLRQVPLSGYEVW